MKRWLLLFIHFSLFGMEQKKDDEFSKTVLALYYKPRHQDFAKRLQPFIDAKIKEASSSTNYPQINALNSLQNILHSSSSEDAPEETPMKRVRAQSEVHEFVSTIVSEAIEEYMTEQEIKGKMLEQDAVRYKEELQTKRILAYLGAGTTLCTSCLGLIAALLVAYTA